jgi:hypothetical protein
MGKLRPEVSPFVEEGRYAESPLRTADAGHKVLIKTVRCVSVFIRALFRPASSTASMS